MPPKTKTLTGPDKSLARLAAQYAKAAELTPERRFTAIGQMYGPTTEALSTARQDAALAWLDQLTAGGQTRTDAMRTIIDKTELARTTVFNVILAAERRAGRPKQAAGRPRKDGVDRGPAPETPSPGRRRFSHAACDHGKTVAERRQCAGLIAP